MVGIKVDWESPTSLLLLNPAYAQEAQQRFAQILKEAEPWPGHFWLATSGSCAPKWVGISKQALLASAEAVNRHLDSTGQDRWVHPLPHFHVGGLGIWARAYLSGAAVYELPGRWQPEAFYRLIEAYQGTLTALVPAQLYDLVQLGWAPPPSLRAMIVGGGPLPSILYARAVALGWPVLPSYGLTECGSQVATAALGSWQRGVYPDLGLLPHIAVREQAGRLSFAGPSLFTVYAYIGENQPVRFVDPKSAGWWSSEDRGALSAGIIKLWGRADTLVKVLGEQVDVAHLEALIQAWRLEMAIRAEVALIPLEDPRLGSKIVLVSDSASREPIAALLHRFQRSVLPFERVRAVCLIKEIPRSPLGKVLRLELMQAVQAARMDEQV